MTSEVIKAAQERCRQDRVKLQYLARIGAHAQGLETEESDDDFIALYAQPITDALGMSGGKETISPPDDYPEMRMMSVRRFVALCYDGNMDVLAWANVPKEMVLFKTWEFDSQILLCRDIFKSKAIAKKALSWASSLLGKMSKPVSRKTGDKRRKRVKKDGYDSKNAVHVIRVLRMACEFFENGRFNVRRDADAEELLSIKNGEWLQKEVEIEASQLVARLKQAEQESSLPDKPDEKVVNSRLVEFYCRVYRL